MTDGMTYGEIGEVLFKRYEVSCNPYEPGCPFANGTADFIGRNNDSYARKFCSAGCSIICTKLMIEENQTRYDKALEKLKEGRM